MAEDTLAALANVRPQRKPSLADLQALLALPQGDPRNDFGRATGAARSVMHGAVVQPLQEIAHGISDLATGEGFTRNVGEGANSLVGLMAGGVTPAIFGGVMAKTANKAALARAEDMVRTGADRGTIWNETGWFKGGDNKWRFEIPDNAARVHPSAAASFHNPEALEAAGSAGSVLRHKDLYSAYPELKKTSVILERSEPGSSGGWFNQPTRAMHAHAHDLDKGTNILLHEMQHGVQAAEGFARGGNPADHTFQGLAQQLRDDAQTRITALQGDLRAFQDKALEARGIKRTDPEWTIHASKLVQDWRRAFPDKAAQMDTAWANVDIRPGMPIYQRLAGEVEARNVQTRQNMTPEQRRAAAPWTTEDVPPAQQIFR